MKGLKGEVRSINWKQEIEIAGRAKKMFVSLEEIQNVLMMSLTKEELEEFAGALIKFAVMGPLNIGEEL